MDPSVKELLSLYNDDARLEDAQTIPASWYVDGRIGDLERQNVFGRNWQPVARVDQLGEPGQYVTTEVAGEPLIVVRGNDQELRAFFNVCRHHAAAVATEEAGNTSLFRCPYHGWSYGLDGSLKGAPEFEGVCGFDRSKNGLLPIRVQTWEQFVFINLDPAAVSLADALGRLAERVCAA